MQFRIAGAVALVVVALSACGDGIDLPRPARLEKVGNGDGQRATAGNRLAVPLSVFITASDGTPVPRVEVIWVVTEGVGASLSDSLTVTDGFGVAQVYLTLGPTAGTYVVFAALAQLPDTGVTFTARAVRPPQLTRVSPESFTGGEVVLLQGSGLSDSVVVEFGGVQAQVLSVSVTGLGLNAEVPRCLVPGPVTIRARVGLATSEGVTGSYQVSSDPLDLGVGEYLSVEPAALEGCATFNDADSLGAEYLLALQSVTGTAGLTLAYRFKGDSAATTVPLAVRTPTEPSLASRFHDFLRAQEAELARLPRGPREFQRLESAPIQVDIKVGDGRTFRVCDKLTCNDVEDFASVRGEVKYVGDHGIIYQDVEAPAGGLTDQGFQALGELFDDVLYEIATRAFGAESDVDLNGRVLILFTPVVNRLTDKDVCETSFVTGFFFPLDISTQSDSDRRSNRAEIFYAMVPDPQGTVTCEHSVDRVNRLIPVTLIHELQHMINFYQHAMLRAGNSEQTWLNEAMSHLAEELGAFHFEALGDSVRFSTFAIGDIFNAYLYLKEPGVHSTIFGDGTGTLEERGASWLFLRWIVDQFGSEVLRRLSETRLVGSDNVAAATGEPMSQLLADWFLANYVSDLEDFTAPGRLRYSSWRFRRTYLSLHQQNAERFDRPFPLEPLEFMGGTFDVTGILRSGSGDYFRVVQAAGQRGFTVELLDGSGDPLSGPAEPRLNVIRIR